ncbi:unnamed protein product [Amoebophrya sp. A25]|nr:unnamed protein product [Amoebophrya sp. A25]|eukprot:GSA25T00021335001.1
MSLHRSRRPPILRTCDHTQAKRKQKTGERQPDIIEEDEDLDHDNDSCSVSITDRSVSPCLTTPRKGKGPQERSRRVTCREAQSTSTSSSTASSGSRRKLAGSSRSSGPRSREKQEQLHLAAQSCKRNKGTRTREWKADTGAPKSSSNFRHLMYSGDRKSPRKSSCENSECDSVASSFAEIKRQHQLLVQEPTTGPPAQDEETFQRPPKTDILSSTQKGEDIFWTTTTTSSTSSSFATASAATKTSRKTTTWVLRGKEQREVETLYVNLTIMQERELQREWRDWPVPGLFGVDGAKTNNLERLNAALLYHAVASAVFSGCAVGVAMWETDYYSSFPPHAQEDFYRTQQGGPQEQQVMPVGARDVVYNPQAQALPVGKIPQEQTYPLRGGQSQDQGDAFLAGGRSTIDKHYAPSRDNRTDNQRGTNLAHHAFLGGRSRDAFLGNSVDLLDFFFIPAVPLHETQQLITLIVAARIAGFAVVVACATACGVLAWKAYAILCILKDLDKQNVKEGCQRRSSTRGGRNESPTGKKRRAAKASEAVEEVLLNKVDDLEEAHRNYEEEHSAAAKSETRSSTSTVALFRDFSPPRAKRVVDPFRKGFRAEEESREAVLDHRDESLLFQGEGTMHKEVIWTPAQFRELREMGLLTSLEDWLHDRNNRVLENYNMFSGLKLGGSCSKNAGGSRSPNNRSTDHEASVQAQQHAETGKNCSRNLRSCTEAPTSQEQHEHEDDENEDDGDGAVLPHEALETWLHAGKKETDSRRTSKTGNIYSGSKIKTDASSIRIPSTPSSNIATKTSRTSRSWQQQHQGTTTTATTTTTTKSKASTGTTSRAPAQSNSESKQNDSADVMTSKRNEKNDSDKINSAVLQPRGRLLRIADSATRFVRRSLSRNRTPLQQSRSSSSVTRMQLNGDKTSNLERTSGENDAAHSEVLHWLDDNSSP